MTRTRRVAILVFDEVELLDFAGPFEVFTVTGRDDDPPPFEVRLVAESPDPVTTRYGAVVVPHVATADCPDSDIILIPGGHGTRREMNNPAVREWVRTQAEKAELVLSVCTGALVLAKCGLLDGLEATTHHALLDLLRETAPAATVRPDRRFVDNGKVITAGGIAAGIDMALHVVARLLGPEAARESARYMEYPYAEEG